MATQFNPDNPVGFFLRDPAQTPQKLRTFKHASTSKLFYVFDFDRTLTTSKHTGEDITTWYILHGVLPEIGQQEMHTLREIYQPAEIAGSLSEQDALTWWNTALNLYVKHPVYMDDIKQAAKKVQLRDGTIQLFKECEALGVPTVILSAGVSDVITAIVGARNIKPSLILSTKFVLAEDGRILGWDRGSMIHILNKREQGSTELSQIHAARPYTILVGDSLQDADMVEGDERVLRIRICDLKHPDEPTRQAYLTQSFAAGFDMVLEEDMQPLAELNQWLAQD
jgi:phosphoserine phosphatase